MKNNFSLLFKKASWLVALCMLIIACENEKTEIEKVDHTEAEKVYVNLSFPNQSSVFTLGDMVTIKSQFDTLIPFTKFELWVDNELVMLDSNSVDSMVISSKKMRVGSHTALCKVFDSTKVVDIENLNFILLSDIVPKVGKFKVIRSYPHLITSFTQGLVYENGKLYEGTGLNGESALKLVNLKTGDANKELLLAQEYFGEGIAIVKNKIIQLTWKNNVGFVYNKKTFEKVKEFNYPTEGWGVTFDGTNLIMSDGSEHLFILDTANFSIIGKVQVYDDKGPVLKLNELEWVNGFVYANIWMTDYIVQIDARSGKVIKQWEMSNLLSQEDKHPKIDVLNGIAINKSTGRYFITGKNWPKLFEIELR